VTDIDNTQRDRAQRRNGIAVSAETLEAWEECGTTGLHVTATEADKWLAQLEQGNDDLPNRVGEKGAG
jgi:hypothetical protein